MTLDNLNIHAWYGLDPEIGGKNQIKIPGIHGWLGPQSLGLNIFAIPKCLGSCHMHRWPFGKNNGPGKWKKAHLNECQLSLTNLKKTPMIICSTLCTKMQDTGLTSPISIWLAQMGSFALSRSPNSTAQLLSIPQKPLF